MLYESHYSEEIFLAQAGSEPCNRIPIWAYFLSGYIPLIPEVSKKGKLG